MLCQPSSRRSSPRPSRAPLRGRGQWECGNFNLNRNQPRPFRTPRWLRKTLQKIVCVHANFRRCDQSNQQYSVTALTDTTGVISERYAYDAYGNLTVLAGGGTVLSGSAYGNRYTYTGREWNGDLGLYHYRARMYSPETGRFVSRDPIGYVDGYCLYRGYFVLCRVDPSGTHIQYRPWNTPTDQPWISTTLTPGAVAETKMIRDVVCRCVKCEKCPKNVRRSYQRNCLITISFEMKIDVKQAKAEPPPHPLPPGWSEPEWTYGHEQRHIRNMRAAVLKIMKWADSKTSHVCKPDIECQIDALLQTANILEKLNSEWEKEVNHKNPPFNTPLGGAQGFPPIGDMPEPS